MATEHRILRDGRAPLIFDGEAVASGDSLGPGDQGNRWHVLQIFRTAGGQWVISVIYRTQWQGELGRRTAEVLDSPESVRQVLERYDPRADVGGYPPIESYAERQARLLDDVERRFRAMVGDVLARVPGLEERIA